jgi:hypothetical protein
VVDCRYRGWIIGTLSEDESGFLRYSTCGQTYQNMVKAMLFFDLLARRRKARG